MTHAVEKALWLLICLSLSLLKWELLAKVTGTDKSPKYQLKTSPWHCGASSADDAQQAAIARDVCIQLIQGLQDLCKNSARISGSGF